MRGQQSSQQSDFFEFKDQGVASEAKMYLSTEPVLFDTFLLDLKSLSTSTSVVAVLTCILTVHFRSSSQYTPDGVQGREPL